MDKTIGTKRKSLLEGMSKKRVQNIPRVRRYLIEAEERGARRGIDCTDKFLHLANHYIPHFKYSDLPYPAKEHYDEIVKAANELPGVLGLRNMANQILEGIPNDR